MIPVAYKDNNVVIAPLSNALSLSHRDCLLGSCDALWQTAHSSCLPILYGMIHPFSNIQSCYICSFFPSASFLIHRVIELLVNSQMWKKNTYVFSTKDPHMIKIYYYQHKKGGSSLSTFTTTEERYFNRSTAYAGHVCNTAKNITWCHMLIWHWFRRNNLIEWSQNNLMIRVQHQEPRNLASPSGPISDYLCNHG